MDIDDTGDTAPAGLADLWRDPSDDEVGEILRDTRSIAVVGVSDDPSRPSHGVFAYLVEHSAYDVYAVNPTIDEVLGRPSYASLADLPVVPDLVDVFRRHSELGAVADEAIAVGARTLWFQLGLRDDAAAQRAHEAGLRVVADRCTKIELARRADR